jgi:Serine/threonine protein phosphatase
MQYVAVSALSHDGLVREHNEDSLVAGPWTLCASTTLTPQTIYFPPGDPLLVAVADGLGGHPAGELASALTVGRLAQLGHALADADAVRKALESCNELIYAEAEHDRARVAMGCTVAGVVLVEDELIVFNVGDSRVYAVAPDGLTRLSTDDNEPARPGQRRSSVVTQTLGGSFGREAIEPHLSTRPLDGSTSYLICTDGLTDALDEDAITAILREHTGGRATFELWKATIEAGAPDNVTIALVEPEW